ncbi:type II toxin-antitoxin system VapC family toxin [Pseudactinotalea sp. Z1748]|uniref:type II toxin-antitoxin system VapC family toxin n=1 Tax=Pseudactinotalea sp. Z1748 TaxID=3413027 RepID=UPI003C7E10C7
MSLVYFDSSALLALVHHETTSVLVRALWDRADAVFASRLADAEVRAVLRAGERSGRVSKEVAGQALERWHRMWPALRKIEVTAAIAERAADLAEEHGLRAGDGIQMASVELLAPANPIVALTDARLAGVATALGLRVLPQP